MNRLTENTKDCFGYRLKDGSDAEIGFFKDYEAFYSHMMTVKALGEYEDLEERGLLLKLPVAVGSKVYEIIEDTVPEHHFYIAEYKVQDVSATAVKYADDWYSFDYPNLYFDRTAAEEKLKELESELNEEIN